MPTGDARGLPVRAALRADGLFLELRDIAADELRDPFMQESVRRVTAGKRIVQVRTEALGAMAPNAAPAGLIFHVGRCGSTLISQLLKLHGGITVYAEPQPVNELLVPPHRADRTVLIAALRSLAAVVAQHAGGRYVLKLSSWNTLYCDLVAEAFPASPWVLCLRDPIEVCVSLLHHRPGWMRDALSPTHPFADVISPGHTSQTQELYLARVFAAFCDAAARLDRRRGKVVTYDALPEAIWADVAAHFGLAVDDDCRMRMAAAARKHAKTPAATFAPDTASKRAAASAALLQAIDALARPAMARLAAC